MLLLILLGYFCHVVNDLCEMVNGRQSNRVHAMHWTAVTNLTTYQAGAAEHHDRDVLNLLPVLWLA